MNTKNISVQRTTAIRDALFILDKSGCGILLLLRSDMTFERTITDGDIRRLLLEDKTMEDTLESLPIIESIVVEGGYTRETALDLMNQHKINHLPVLDEGRRVKRVLERRELDEQILLSTPHMGSWELEFVEEAFRTNWIAPLGPNVDAFEREMEEYVGIKHAAALSSGTAAIHLALHILGVTQGDTVFCSSLTFVASANPILYRGATPVFIDSEPDTWNMSPQALERAFVDAEKNEKLPKAVIIVNLYGQSADFEPLLALCNQYDVPVVEDAAESLGATYKGKGSGTLGAMGIYSFNGNKIITTSGGGMLVSDNEDYIRRAKYLATQGREPAAHYEHVEMAYNYRMSNVLAGIGRGQLKVIEDRILARQKLYQHYRDGLQGLPVKMMPTPTFGRCTHWLSAITVDTQRTVARPKDILAALAEEKIEGRPIWKPMHLQPLFANAPYYAHYEDGNSVSGDLFELGVCLPSGSNLADYQQEKVIEVLNRFLRN